MAETIKSAFEILGWILAAILTLYWTAYAITLGVRRAMAQIPTNNTIEVNVNQIDGKEKA